MFPVLLKLICHFLPSCDFYFTSALDTSYARSHIICAKPSTLLQVSPQVCAGRNSVSGKHCFPYTMNLSFSEREVLGTTITCKLETTRAFLSFGGWELLGHCSPSPSSGSQFKVHRHSSSGGEADSSPDTGFPPSLAFLPKINCLSG